MRLQDFPEKKNRIDYHIPRITYCYTATSNNFKAKKAFKNNIMSKKRKNCISNLQLVFGDGFITAE